MLLRLRLNELRTAMNDPGICVSDFICGVSATAAAGDAPCPKARPQAAPNTATGWPSSAPGMPGRLQAVSARGPFLREVVARPRPKPCLAVLISVDENLNPP
jgi:hypothetical protein